MNKAEYDKFLGGLQKGDMVLVCQEDGEVRCTAKVWRAEDKIIRAMGGGELRYNEETFSRKTGRQRGGSLILRPYDDVLYQEHVVKTAKLTEEYRQRKQAYDAEKRDGLKVAILSVADMIGDENLDGLSTDDLQSLMTILNKLGGE
jgi:hypothetical protein